MNSLLEYIDKRIKEIKGYPIPEVLIGEMFFCRMGADDELKRLRDIITTTSVGFK